uniref:Parvin gamma n=1 Tax=Pundamilia nyererei TaxID=303518 RepID=A0A3B4FDK6_9CICH
MEENIFNYQKEEDFVFMSITGEKRKLIQPTSLKDPKLEKLKEALVDWINKTLKPEHIVVQSLEEDVYDGLVLHHLLSRLADVHLNVEEIALTSTAQIRKLEIIMEELGKRLGTQDSSQIKWNVKLNKCSLLHVSLHQLRRILVEIKFPDIIGFHFNHMSVLVAWLWEDPIEQLLKLEAHKVNTVKKALVHFVNQHISSLGLQVIDMDKQFADGVILLLLIGQLEGFFIPLFDFNLTPVSDSEMLHNVTLALDLLKDTGFQLSSVDPQDIVSLDTTATLKVLYALFNKHKGK